MRFESKISLEQLLQLPLYSYDGEVIVVDSAQKFNEIRQELFLNKIWGFDTETKPSFRKGVSSSKSVALLQLSSMDKTYLFRLNKISLQNELITLLSSPEYLKIGVALRDDLRFLKKIHNFDPAGFIDLQNIAKEYGIEDMSLKKLAAIVLGVRISKSQQLSNWEAERLSEKQIKYAATDSWISREIYINLINSEKNDSTRI
ncbi:3'-5' exonuclease domain-containing protein 2 [Bacteroidales bacterium OttesenSCG-928-I21]|nr:3'-5' exonuclease domain-containing protein 2 [Bacteroidales bacterium OttesenSCG-928-I21]